MALREEGPLSRKESKATDALLLEFRFDDLVALARGEPPDPIPNSAVKTLSADGTAPQGAEE